MTKRNNEIVVLSIDCKPTRINEIKECNVLVSSIVAVVDSASSRAETSEERRSERERRPRRRKAFE